jgi:monothiol glutaredoxin
MPLAAATRDRIDQLLAANRVVLFMKGTRQGPQCGFSAATVDRLDTLLDDYATVDVLADDEIRQGIKEYGNWPTIPQLYVDRELVGGADIVQSMFDSGELHRVLGVAEPDRTPPEITVSDAAVAAIRQALTDADGMKLFLVVDGHFQPQFQLREPNGNEVVVNANGLEICFDLASAQRARGASIDWTKTAHGEGLAIHLPMAPPAVKSIDVHALKQRLDAGDITVIDVRPPQDRALAPFARAEILDASTHARLAALPKETALAFLCHVGNSSRRAAEHFREHGFRDVYNVDGGIDAWSREIDSSVPRY